MDSILPAIDIELETVLEDFDEVTTETAITPIGKSLKFDFIERKFVFENGKNIRIESEEEIKQWITLLLVSYKDKYKVYKDTDFHCNIEDLTGQKPTDYIIAELEREISEAVITHRFISSIENFKIEYEKRTLTVSFTVILKDNATLSIIQNL
ncbi:DUF2634 domain-containing protein [Clostridium sp. CF012]|uniref:DUF2634 domain-containing protein n=1 Tax=Clostridium sp. CF012 TaxID=2843319 RepID=UPI001C0D97C6|nr:DUF2634 domain-containing protein [Clostridium sp. CF012]MBU3146904.1 DUF2634 domain-containing protein [Clostridium sp. CF012]